MPYLVTLALSHLTALFLFKVIIFDCSCPVNDQDSNSRTRLTDCGSSFATDRSIQRLVDRYKGRQVGRLVDRYKGRQVGRNKGSLVGRQVYRNKGSLLDMQVDRNKGSLVDMQVDRNKGWQAGRQINGRQVGSKFSCL